MTEPISVQNLNLDVPNYTCGESYMVNIASPRELDVLILKCKTFSSYPFVEPTVESFPAIVLCVTSCDEHGNEHVSAKVIQGTP